MPYSRKGNRPPGKSGPRPRPPHDESFGYDPPAEPAARPVRPPEIPQLEAPEFKPAAELREVSPEILALGAPPTDANEIQRWNYRMLSTRAWLVSQDAGLPDEARDKRVMQLLAAAARHYPVAAKKDLADKIDRDAAEIAGRKRAKAAAQLEKAPAAGGAKVIPIRRDG